MPRILALVLLVGALVIGCTAEPTAPPTQPPAIPTEEPTIAPAATDTAQPTNTTAPATTAPTSTTQPTATTAPVTGKVKSALNVREQPRITATLLGVLRQGDTVTIVGRTDDKTWLQINYPLGEKTTAWVIAERIDTTANLDNLPTVAQGSATAVATQVAANTTVTGTVTIPSATPLGTPTRGAGTPGATVTATARATTTVTATAAVTASATVTTSATATVTAAPTVSGATGGTPPGSIIFDSYENGNFNIYRVRADGSGLTQLISGGSDPALSPNGATIAYRARRDVGGLGIRLASSTGQDLSILTEESAAGYPTWSPDGNNIAYHILPSGRLSGQVLRIGAGPDNTPSVIGIGVRPSWEPGRGTFVLFDGCQGGSNCGSLLTENAFEATPETPNLIEFGQAGAWSPNAAQLAFQANDDKGNTQIWVSDAGGANRRQVTTDTGTHGLPIWSSDGQWLFYRTDQGGTGWAIYAIRANGTSARKIVDSNVHPDQWVYAKLAIAP